jgi:aminoglycoside phosphotransferase (APT) family kinase protein
VDDLTIDAAFVRALLRRQHPDLAGLELRAVPGGWDNMMWRLGDDLAVRLPRTPRGPALLRQEQRWLPVVAAGLPLPVPVPVRTGEPTADFPKYWGVVRWVPGEPADQAPISDPASADSLAAFLRALHRAAPSDAPAGTTRGVPLATVQSQFPEWITAIDAGDLADQARQVWARALAAPAWHQPARWLHGDLHPANVVVRDGALCGVLDFGEICAGDPAVDLAAAWVLLPAGTASRFFHAYGDVDEATIRRTEGWAVFRAAGLIRTGRRGDLGLPGGKPTWGTAGRAALQRVLAAAR